MHGLRYSAEHDTFLNQVGNDGVKAPLKSGDRDVGLDWVLPADMAAHIGLFGQQQALLHKLHLPHVGAAQAPVPGPSRKAFLRAGAR